MRLILLVAGFAMAGAVAASANDYPSDPIDMVVGYAAGGTSDTAARLVAERLSEELGQPIVIENRPGAATTVASNWVKDQPADGYTLYAASVSLALNPLLQPEADYEIGDFDIIAGLADSPFVLHASPQLGVSDMDELLEVIRERPGELAIATSGAGAINHLIAEYWMDQLDLDLIVAHYQGDAPARQDLMAGNVQLSFTAAPVALPLVESGDTSGIAVTTTERLPQAPDLPTVAEAADLDGFEAVFWKALVAPAGLPDDVMERLAEAMEVVGADEALAETLLEQGLLLSANLTAEEISQRFDEDAEVFGRLIDDAGIELD